MSENSVKKILGKIGRLCLIFVMSIFMGAISVGTVVSHASAVQSEAVVQDNVQAAEGEDDTMSFIFFMGGILLVILFVVAVVAGVMSVTVGVYATEEDEE